MTFLYFNDGKNENFWVRAFLESVFTYINYFQQLGYPYNLL